MLVNRSHGLKTLYIIGNGFDLYHGLPTKPSNFSEYLKLNNKSLFDLFESYYFFDSGKDLWSELEKNLANLDVDWLSERISGIHEGYSFSIEINSVVNSLTSGLRESFRNFILSVCESNEVDFGLALSIDIDAVFLSFNYSDTLEKYYAVPVQRINYIHGKASRMFSEIILGHGINPSKLKRKKVREPEGLSDEEREYWCDYMSDQYDFYYELGMDELDDYFASSFKNTSAIISANEEFFSSLKVVDNVCVLGHSLSDVDLHYFEAVKSFVSRKCNWNVSYYGEHERLKHYETMINLGIEQNYINMFKLTDIALNRITRS